MKKLILLLLLGLVTTPGVAADKAEHLDVLLVHSYHQDYPWTVSQHQAFIKTLQAAMPEHNIVFSTEYLDTKRVEPTKAYKKSFLQYLVSKYKDHVPDLIYTTDDNALDFIDSQGFSLWQKSPIVFSGLNNPSEQRNNRNNNVTGVYEIKDISETLSLARQIASLTDSIIFLGDGGTTDLAIDKRISPRLKQAGITHIHQADIEKVLDTLNSIEPSVIVLTTVGGMHDSSGQLLSLQQIINTIAATGHKILVMEDTYLLPGVIGGYITSGNLQGATAAKLALRIIKGASAEDIKPVVDSRSELVLDWNMLQKLNQPLDEPLLKTARIINKPLPFLQNNPYITRWLLVFVGVLLIIIVGFIYNSRQKNRLLNEQRIDRLTGLGNRVKLLQDIEKTQTPCLAIIDINNFKVINNLYSIKIGDAILVSYAHQISEQLGNEATLYRMAGDRFAILRGVTIAPKEFAIRIEQIINHIQSNQYSFGDLEINLTVTAGISGKNKELLIPRAEQALQQARANNKPYAITDGSTDNTSQQKENILWAQKLHSALEGDRVIPFFQPIVNNKTGQILEHEALVRIIDKDGSIISPCFFLDAAKTTRQYEQLTHTMIKQVLDKIKKCSASISINFTVEDIRNDKTVRYLKQEISQNDVANRVIIELTESEGIENYSEVAKFIDDIKKLGCRVSIDDFGSGYSNFTHLIHLNADYLKIDGSIIKDILTDKGSELVAQSIVDFAKRLNMETIAEVVDSQEVLEKVTALGIDYSQGDFIGKPDPEPC